MNFPNPQPRVFTFAVAAVLFILAYLAFINPIITAADGPGTAHGTAQDFDYPTLRGFNPSLNCPAIVSIVQQFGRQPLFGLQTVEDYFKGLCLYDEPAPIRFSSQNLGFEAVLPPIQLQPGIYTATLDTTSSHILFQDLITDPPYCYRPPIFGFEPPTRFQIEEDCTIFLTLANNPPSLAHHWLFEIKPEAFR